MRCDLIALFPLAVHALAPASVAINTFVSMNKISRPAVASGGVW